MYGIQEMCVHKLKETEHLITESDDKKQEHLSNLFK